ncbi:MAG: hypothetical protein J1E38_09790 [Paramuribaculum sp.]|nr:hypothetical protein [Paramuribaculum sp.]
MPKSDTIDLRRQLRTFRRYCWLYVIIFLVISGAAIALACIGQSRYDSEALLLIEESNDESSQKSGLMNIMRSFTTGGGFGRASVDNEILLLSSRDVARRTVDALQLNVEISEKNGLSKKLLFKNPPLKVDLSEGLSDKLTKGLTVNAHENGGKWNVKLKESGYFGKVIAEKNNVTLPITFSTPSGNITLNSDSLNKPKPQTDYLITISNSEIVADNLYKNVKVSPRDKVSDVIELTITDVGTERGAEILNEMMRQYNAKRLERRKENSLTELDFLNERIALISEELSESEKKVEQFKTDKQFVNIASEAPILFGEALGSHKDLLATSAEIAYYDQVLNLLDKGTEGLLPAIAVPGSDNNAGSHNQLISDYNKEVMAIKELEKSALPGNSALERANQRLDNLKGSIRESFSQLLTSARLAQSKQSGATGKMDERLKNMPAYEREYIALYRDNALKNELYGYLVEKRENAMLQYYSLSTLGFVIDEAHTAIKPSLKRPAIFIVGAVVFAFILILSLVIIFTRRKQTVSDSMDLADMGLEDNSVTIRKDRLNEAAARARSFLNADKKPKAVFIADMGHGDDFFNALVDSFNNAQLPYKKIELSNESIDIIVSPSVSRQIGDNLRNGVYPIIEIPQADKTNHISSEINAEESRLIMVIPEDAVGRKELYELTRPMLDSHIFVVILKG